MITDQKWNNNCQSFLRGRILFFLLIYILLLSCGEKSKDAEQSTTLFKLLDSTQTGVNFINRVVDKENFNILTYRNFYNGGGVAIGDINNDSLPDLYFTSNQEKNRLYLNKGNFQFEDITDRAGVAGSMSWSTGVTMADVNNDGLLDIYVCNSGDVDGKLRENELFINNGNLTFTEKARDYNLNNEGYSTHAAFFDYDVDGDLDCYILNNSFKDPAKIELYNKQREKASPIGDKLMRNDGAVFTDVTMESGIFSSEIGFGLGVCVSDINQDKLPDIYISNDFWERDYLYLNKGNGKFLEQLPEFLDYCSVSSMGADIADVNNDGAPEIFTTDMLPADNYRLKTTIAFDPYHLEDTKYRANFHYQMIQNCLHLNDGKGKYQEVAFYSGVAATDWSWGALIFDFQNDGRQDIFVSNGIYKDIMAMDFRDFLADAESKRTSSTETKDPQLEFISKMPSQALKNYAFEQVGPVTFEDKSDSLGLREASFSNGSAYGDLDNDGDPDLVLNNVNSPSFIYRNYTREKIKQNHFLKIKFAGPEKNRFGIGARVVAKSAGKMFTLENFNNRGFQSSIEPSLLLGLGNINSIDTLTVMWPDGKMETMHDVKADELITFDYRKAMRGSPSVVGDAPTILSNVSAEVITPTAVHRENRYNDFNNEILLVKMLSTEGPRVVKGDANGDKREDFILLGARGDADKLYIQNGNGKFSHKKLASLENDKGFESTCGAMFDHDGDGDLDLMIGSGGNEIEHDGSNYVVRYYTNDGHGNFSPDPNSMPRVVGNFSTMEAEDYDRDGDIDVFLGARCVPGSYGLPPKNYLLQNYEGDWVDMATPALGNAGMVTDASWTDVDKDGDKDLVVVGDWMPVQIFVNDFGFEKVITVPESKGWWNRVEAADLDNDGDEDFILGNWGLNSKFKASKKHPLTMAVNDFDNNGKSEFFINWYAPGDTAAFPFALKPEVTTQLPGLRKSILKYEQYASQTWNTMFTKEIADASLTYTTTTLESGILWNDGKSFRLEELPMEAQLSPIFGITTVDLNADGYLDILMGGNFYALKPQVGRQNSNRGLALLNDKKGNFSIVRAGFDVEGEVRDMLPINIGTQPHVMVARNNASVLLFKKK